jgi:N-acetylmuramoyl-L-alanine amidase
MSQRGDIRVFQEGLQIAKAISKSLLAETVENVQLENSPVHLANALFGWRGTLQPSISKCPLRFLDVL